MAQDPTPPPLTPPAAAPPTVKTDEHGNRLETYADRVVLVYADGRPPKSKPLYRQNRTADQVENIAGNPHAVLPKQDFGAFGKQHQEAGSAVYNAQPGQQFDWADFRARHGDYIDQNFQGGFPAFVGAIQDKKYSKTATDWFQQAANDHNRQQGKRPYFLPADSNDPNPNRLDGKFGNITYSVPSFTEPAAQPAPEAPGAVVPAEAGADPTYDAAPPSDTKWWQQDVVNMAAALTDKVNKYNPALQQVKYEVPDYALLDPSRQVAAVQENAARFQDLAMNTSSGAVARANVLGSAGQGAAQIADILGQYENQNVGISNAASGAQAQIHNQETDVNTRYLDKFIGEQATANQQYDNAMRDLKYRRVDAYNQGTTNAMKQTQLEQVLPQVHVNRNTGRMEFSGTGKDLAADEAFGVGLQSPADATNQNLAYYKDGLAKAVAAGMKPDDAHDYVVSQLGLYQPKDNKSKAALARQMLQAGAAGPGKFTYGGQAPALPEFGC